MQMQVYKIRSFHMKNVLRVEVEIGKENELGFAHYSEMLLSYACELVGPQMFQVSGLTENDKSEKILLFYPINKEVTNIQEKNISFLKEINYDKALYIRVQEADTDLTYEIRKLLEYAHQEGFSVADSPYQIRLNLYGDIITDIYVPLKTEVGF